MGPATKAASGVMRAWREISQPLARTSNSSQGWTCARSSAMPRITSNPMAPSGPSSALACVGCHSLIKASDRLVPSPFTAASRPRGLGETNMARTASNPTMDKRAAMRRQPGWRSQAQRSNTPDVNRMKRTTPNDTDELRFDQSTSRAGTASKRPQLGCSSMRTISNISRVASTHANVCGRGVKKAAEAA